MLHELGHVIGFWHEQSRPDRDSHVNVDKNAIEEGRLYNFYKSSWQYVDTKNVSYDVSSIMHYSATVSYSLRKQYYNACFDGFLAFDQNNWVKFLTYDRNVHQHLVLYSANKACYFTVGLCGSTGWWYVCPADPYCQGCPTPTGTWSATRILFLWCQTCQLGILSW